MRSFLVFLGSILMALMVVGGIGLVYTSIRSPQLDRESRAFVDSAVQAIASSWDEQALLDRATPELVQAVGLGALDRMFERFRQLGALRDYEGADGDASITLNSKGFNVTALYFARAAFVAGDATLRISLTRRGGEWRIVAFRVDSSAISRPAQTSVSASLWAGTARDADVEAYGPGSEGFNRWCRASLSATSLRYQSATEVWIALSETYGPYPTTALAARAAAKYLVFDTGLPFAKVVLFRGNQRVAEATVNRP